MSRGDTEIYYVMTGFSNVHFVSGANLKNFKVE